MEAAQASVSLAGGGSSGGPSSLERLRPEMEALKARELLRPNLDVVAAGSLVLAALPRIEALAPQMRHLVSEQRVWGLRERANAAIEASAGLGRRERRWIRIKEALAEARRRRRSLRRDAAAAVGFGLLGGAPVPELTAGRRSTDVAKDLYTLAYYFSRHFEELRGRTPLTIEYLVETSTLALDLIERLGARTRPPSRTVDPVRKDRRARAFTLLVRDYEAVRAAVVFLRRLEGDADAIAPSLYAARRRRPPRRPVGSG
jgi:hypothetical protein